MATTTIKAEIERIRNSGIWRSIFRSGSGTSNLHRSQAVQQNLLLHLFSVKIRSRALEFRPTWYLGALTLSTFLILVVTGILLMFYYHPSVPQAYADMKDLQFVVASGVFCGICIVGLPTPWCSWSSLTCSRCFTAARIDRPGNSIG